VVFLTENRADLGELLSEVLVPFFDIGGDIFEVLVILFKIFHGFREIGCEWYLMVFIEDGVDDE
jgi:hypothetical protein